MGLAIVLASSIPALASPPPPPPAFIDNIAQQLISTPTSDNFDRYAALLATGLTVTLNGNEIAASKVAWLTIQRQQLGKVDRFVYGYAEGRDNILVMDRSDDRSDEHCPSGGGCVFDPRWHARAVRYEIGADHLVHAIRILDTDSVFQVPRDR
jgi:hypothetical protein